MTRNTAMSNINLAGENKAVVLGKGGSSIPVMKRKAQEGKEGAGLAKRAAFGDLTNARAGEGPSKGGKDGKETTMKKLSGMIKNTKGSLALRGKESKQTLVKKNSVVEAIKKSQEKEVKKTLEKEVKKTQKEISPSSSSSSEEGLMCVFSDNETSSEEKVVDRVARQPSRLTPPEGVEDFDLENMEDPQQHSEYVMETFKYYKDREAAFRVADYIEEIGRAHV